MSEMHDLRAEVQDPVTDAGPEAMRTNPEVMGRKEPVTVEEAVARTDSERERETAVKRDTPPTDGARERETARTADQMSFWPQMTDFRQRMTDIQSEFIDEPRTAVTKAEKLVEDAIDHLARAVHDNVKRMHGEIEKGADTEKLRLVMRNLREFIDSLESRRVA